jgi:hypothetical protein
MATAISSPDYSQLFIYHVLPVVCVYVGVAVYWRVEIFLYPRNSATEVAHQRIKVSRRRFVPTNSWWRRLKCVALDLPSPPPSRVENRQSSLLGPPSKIDKIIGDGNCLFRALSKEVSLTEEYHPRLRRIAINTLMSPRYRSKFEEQIGKSVPDYIRNSKMARNGTWGTDVEVYALATFLETPIAMYYRAPGTSYHDWYYYQPIHWDDWSLPKVSCIYLRADGNHFDRVLAVTKQNQ